MRCLDIMPTLNLNETMPYSQKQMYDLVADIESYSEFIAFIERAHCTENYESNESLWALDCHLFGISFSLETKNKFFPHDAITMKMPNTHISRLDGRWDFLSKGQMSTEINLKIDYEISSILPWLSFDGYVERVAKNVLEAFKERAKLLYGQ